MSSSATGASGDSAPEVSVIVPMYDIRDHVAACIASLRAQTFRDFEVLVIDDGSTDDSAAQAEVAIGGDARFTLIRQDNGGLSAARNAGLDRARGTLIGFVDSDDQVTPDFLGRLRAALVEHDADWVACAVHSCFADGTGQSHSAIHGAAALADHPIVRRYSFGDWRDVIPHFPSAWNKLYRRSLIEGLRFDEGTWFEDHSFFHRAAARTDHILHVPEPLYLQTRGRTGQITSQDSDRVFEQFEVLIRLRKIMREPDRPGADTAFARLASRLVFERSIALKTPERRARFAARAAAFLREEDIAFDADWDADIGRSWALELAGELPLSVVLPWDGKDAAALAATRDSLAVQDGPGFEVLIVCPNKDAATPLLEPLGQARALQQRKRGAGAARTLGLQEAQGRFVVFLNAGDVLAPAALLAWVEAMLRDEADLGLSQYRPAPEEQGAQREGHNGFLTDAPTPPAGPLRLDAPGALAVAPELSARIFRRDFLREQEVRFTDAPHSGWAAIMGAAWQGQVTHIPWAGVDLAPPRGTRALGLRRLARGYAATLRALPTEIRGALPDGWQRRLYARALSSEIARTRHQSRLRKALVLGYAALGALWRGFSGPRPRPASFDPGFGPRSRLLLDPAGLVGQLLGRPRTFSAHERQVEMNLALKWVDPPAPADRLITFDLAGSAVLRLRADFDAAPNLNLHFFAADRARIPFHLSLRRGEAIAVCNNRGPDRVWGPERVRAFDPDSSSVEVTVHIAPPVVTVWVDGVEIFRFGRVTPWSRRGFRGLETIAFLGFEGLAMLQEVRPAQVGPGLALDPRLMIRAPGGPDDLSLETGERTTLPLTAPDLGPAPGTPSVAALFPGRLWCDVDAQAPLRLRLLAEGVESSTLEISRADMADRLDGLLRRGLPHSDGTLVLNVLEHLRHGALMGLLCAEARAEARKLAAYYGLTAFMEAAETEDSRAPTLPAPPPDALGRQVDAARARFAFSQRRAAPLDPADVLKAMPLEPAARHGLMLSLSESFCAPGRDMATLFALYDPETMPPLDPNGDPWHDSAILPFLFCQRRFETLGKTVNSLVWPARQGWVVTPALAWVVRQVLDAGTLDDAQRYPVLRGFMDFVAARAPDYWERAHCAALTDAAAALAAARNQTPEIMHGEIRAFILRNYGLSRLFWRLIAETPGAENALPPELVVARDAFADIEAGTDAAAIDAALLFFERHDAPEASRLRRELLGPAGLPLHKGKTLRAAELAARGPEAALAAVRHMANPDAGPVDGGVETLARRTLPEPATDRPRAPYFNHQFETVQRITAWSQAPRDGDDLNAVLTRCTRLAGGDSRHLGIAMALAMLARTPEPDGPAATRIGDWIDSTVAGLGPSAPTTLREATAVRMAMMRLSASGRDLQTLTALLLGSDANAFPFAGDAYNAGLPDGNPLYDTIVTVFSCLSYLETRVPAMRDGWLRLLEDLCVPYVFVVGNGDGRREGDLLHLDAPDDYEGLPQKTLATIRWVHDKTRFTHMLKVDDDCFVNAPLFFGALNYRKFDYHGRRLYRFAGQTDRAWHQEKSTSDRGRQELDRSPEPSTYADGGSGYTLSRRAMAEVLAAAQTAEGKQLIQTSFMEDKLVGDLLALRGIAVSEEDYRTSIRRRTFGQATPVSYWNANFFPSPTAPVMTVHMDTHQGQQELLKGLETPGLRPSYIWPSYQDVRLGYQSNALELLSPGTRVQAARDAQVAVVACMRNEMFMLPHFLAHYRKLGVDAFLIADNTSDDGTREYLLEQPDVTLFSVDTDYRLSRYGVAWQQAMLAAFRVGKWSLVADADELLVWQRKQRETLPQLLARPDFQNAEAARIFMLDMYPQGPLERADFASGDPFAEAAYCDRMPFLENWPGQGPFSDQPTWTSALRHRLIAESRPDLFVAQKIALLRYHPWMRLSAGLHFVGDVKLASRELLFGHFKYNADFRRKAQEEVARKQHFNDAEEYRKYLALASEGRSVIQDADLSVHWKDSPFVAARLDQPAE